MRESLYEIITLLNETNEKKIYLVRDQLSHVLYVKKICPPIEDITIYEAARGVGHAETGHRPHEHHAFDTQVENAAFFVNENTDGGNQQGRTCIQRRSNDRSNHTSIHD